MKPGLVELAKSTVEFVRYEDGKLWYRADWHDAELPYTARSFEFPIPTDAPTVASVASDAVQALRMLADTYQSDAMNKLAHAIAETLDEHNQASAGAGQFLPRDKGIRFLRWMRAHMQYLEDAKQSEDA